MTDFDPGKQYGPATVAADASSPRVTIVIPSWTGEVSRTLASIDRQTFRDYTIEVVTGVGPAARARNLGAARTAGDILVFLDDDAYLGSDDVLEKLVAVLDASERAAVVGASKLVPETASRLQRAVARQVPRMEYPVQPTTRESNPPLNTYGFSAVTTTCCAVRRQVFNEVGGFDSGLPTGPEDTDFFYRVYRAGHHILLAGQTWVYHDPPSDVAELVGKSFRYGRGHAAEARKHPDRNMALIPLSRWYGKLLLLLAPFGLPFALLVHFYFDPCRRIRFGFRPLKTLSTYAVLCGYAYGWFRGTATEDIQSYMGRPGSVPLRRGSRLRVAMFSRRPASAHGGVEHVVRAIAHQLAAQQPEWTVEMVSAFESSGGLESINGLSDVVAALCLAWKLARGRFDVVFIHCPECMWMLLALRRFVAPRSRVIAVWHGAGPRPSLVLRSPGDPFARALAWFRCREEIVALHADAHVVVHPSVARDLRTYYGYSGAVTVAENAVEPEMLARLESNPPRQANDRMQVVWVGQADHRKGLDIAIEACRIARAAIPHLSLRVVGLPPRAGPDWITWGGVLGPGSMHTAYQNVDVFLFPSRYESFGLVVVEAMAAGLPVVISDAVPEGIVEQERNGVIVAGHDPTDYARSLVRLWRDPLTRSRMSGINRDDARRFSWPVAAQRYAAVAQTTRSQRVTAR